MFKLQHKYPQLRAATHAVAQLQHVLEALISAKVIFVNRVFDWQARTACAAGDLLAFLRYGGTSQGHNGYSRHSHDLRTAKGSSWMRIVHVMLYAFPEVVSKCLEQEIPHLEIKMDFRYPAIHTREQLVNC